MELWIKSMISKSSLQDTWKPGLRIAIELPTREKLFTVASTLMEGPHTGTLDHRKAKHLPLLGTLLSLAFSNRATGKVVGLSQASDCSMLTPTSSQNQALCSSFLQRARVGHTCEALLVLQKAQSCSDKAALTNSHYALTDQRAGA